MKTSSCLCVSFLFFFSSEKKGGDEENRVNSDVQRKESVLQGMGCVLFWKRIKKKKEFLRRKKMRFSKSFFGGVFFFGFRLRCFQKSKQQ